LPRLKYKKLPYIKKIKKEKQKKEDEPIIPEFLSKREYKHYVDLKTTLDK
jgi:deoxyinosine 3'endonuclease (endonuclease V)